MGSSKPTAAQVAQRDLSGQQNKADVNVRERFMMEVVGKWGLRVAQRQDLPMCNCRK